MALKKRSKKKKQTILPTETSTTIDNKSQVEGVLSKISQKTKKSLDEVEKEFSDFQAMIRKKYGQGLTEKSFIKLFAKSKNLKLASSISTKGPITTCKEFNEFMEQNPDGKDTRFTLRGFLIMNRHEWTRGNQDESKGAKRESKPCMHAIIMDDTGGADVYAWAKSTQVWEDWCKSAKPKIGDCIQVTGYPLGKRLTINSQSNPMIVEGMKISDLAMHQLSDMGSYSFVHIKGIGIEAVATDAHGCSSCYNIVSGKDRQKCIRCNVPDTPIKVKKVKFTLGMEDRNDVMCDVSFPVSDKKQSLRVKRIGRNPTVYEVFGMKVPSGEVRVIMWNKVK
mgnify:CR=1 FL=1